MYITLPFKRILAVTFTLAAAVAAIFWCGRIPETMAAGTVPHDGIPLPIVMYHSMLRQTTGKNKYIVTPASFEEDLKYLKTNGYTPVFIQDLINYVSEGTSLPERPILLTFDDGYYNNYLYAYPLAKQYGCKIIIAPIGYVTDQFSKADANHATYSHVTWDQINEMMASGYVEFQNHSYNLHGSRKGARLGTKKLNGEDLAHYHKLLTDDIGQMQAEMIEHTGFRPTAFVYPFGAISNDSVPILRELGFSCTLTCESRMNYITRDPECLYGLGRYLRTPEKSSADFFSKILPQ